MIRHFLFLFGLGLSGAAALEISQAIADMEKDGHVCIGIRKAGRTINVLMSNGVSWQDLVYRMENGQFVAAHDVHRPVSSEVAGAIA